MAITLLLLYNDFRLSDHPALGRALQSGRPVIPVYIHDAIRRRPLGGASKWWLHHSLTAFYQQLAGLGSRLVIRQGDTLDQVAQLISELDVSEVVLHIRWDPASQGILAGLKSLENDRLKITPVLDAELCDKQTIRTKSGGPFKVFTPFYKTAVEHRELSSPIPAPSQWPESRVYPETLAINQLNLLPNLNWADGFGDHWSPGESGAHEKFAQFSDRRAVQYSENRNIPSIAGTSRLSPHLVFGEISPRQIVLALADQPVEAFIRQLYWREFAQYTLFHFPHSATGPLYEKWRRFTYDGDPAHLTAWQRGQTGYPIVDAGMRELWATGWMHNRVRMIVASFLVKDLQISWQEGEAWFWDTLVDADIANNALGWQWCAGCGVDAQPYFRVFNPTSQGQKFDPEGSYINTWVPEKENYPSPIVDHAVAREIALTKYQAFNQSEKSGQSAL